MVCEIVVSKLRVVDMKLGGMVEVDVMVMMVVVVMVDAGMVTVEAGRMDVTSLV
jgi:hypothetical protein